MTAARPRPCARTRLPSRDPTNRAVEHQNWYPGEAWSACENQEEAKGAETYQGTLEGATSSTRQPRILARISQPCAGKGTIERMGRGYEMNTIMRDACTVQCARRGS